MIYLVSCKVIKTSAIIPFPPLRVLKIALIYLLIAEIIEMAQPAPMVNLPRSPLYYYLQKCI